MGMWWEIVPSFAIIVVVGYLPYLGQSMVHRLVLGSAYERRLENKHTWTTWQRDRTKADSSFWYRNRFNKGIADGMPNKTYGLEKYD